MKKGDIPRPDLYKKMKKKKTKQIYKHYKYKKKSISLIINIKN